MSTTVYDRIKASPDLPSPPGVILQILHLAADENATAEQIADVVELDPAISARVLKLVNSPLAGMPRQVGSVYRAVVMLGMHTVTSLTLGVWLVTSHRTGRCETFDYELFWSDAVGRASSARHLVHRLGTFAADEAFTCGLLSQIGRLALACAFPEHYADALRTLTSDDPAELARVERELFDIDHDELAAAMMRDWHLPAIFCDAVRLQTTVDRADPLPASRTVQLARVLHLAHSIAGVLIRPTVYRDTLSALVVEADALGVAPEVYHEVFDSISQEWREAARVFSVHARQVPPLAALYREAKERLDTLQKAPAKPCVSSPLRTCISAASREAGPPPLK